MQLQSVYYGDCLKHLTHWNNWNRWDENNNARLKMDRKLADLIYLDPPWNSDTYYNITYESADNKAKGNTAQSTVFTDVWKFEDAAEQRLAQLTKEYLSPNDPFYPLLRARDCIAGLEKILGRDSMLAYLTYMAERLAMCRELLKETGSIYLHCDPFASHYLKLIMDAVFGKGNFRNEITWKRQTNSGTKAKSTRKFGSMHDIIFFYAKSDKAKMRKLYLPVTEEYLAQNFTMQDERGRFKTEEIQEPSKAKLAEYEQDGLLYKTKTGRLRKKKYDWQFPGELVGDLWTDFMALGSNAKERRGYRTQKPLKLLKRIIEASTNEGDVVLDPFCGCGPAVVGAYQLKRQFVGIDISLFTVQSVVRVWLQEIGLGDIRIAGIPEDLASARQLAVDDPFAFESFAIELCHPAFVANKEQRKDGGTDGKGVLLQPVKENGKWKNIVLVQVKGGKNAPDINKVKAFARDIEKTEGVICGVFITVEEKHWTKEMKKIAKEMGKFKYPHSASKYPRLQHWHIKRADLRAREETMFEGLPNLPELMGLDKKALIPRQADFGYWKTTEEEN